MTFLSFFEISKNFQGFPRLSKAFQEFLRISKDFLKTFKRLSEDLLETSKDLFVRFLTSLTCRALTSKAPSSEAQRR